MKPLALAISAVLAAFAFIAWLYFAQPALQIPSAITSAEARSSMIVGYKKDLNGFARLLGEYAADPSRIADRAWLQELVDAAQNVEHQGRDVRRLRPSDPLYQKFLLYEQEQEQCVSQLLAIAKDGQKIDFLQTFLLCSSSTDHVRTYIDTHMEQLAR